MGGGGGDSEVLKCLTSVNVYTMMFIITRCAFTARGKNNHTCPMRTVNAFYHLLTKNTLVHYCNKVIDHTHHAYV